jgi:NADP-reducing hydrogenase subunit HndB
LYKIFEKIIDGGNTMKSLAELAAIREKMQNKVVIREGEAATRVVVGMATCGIAAGARPVLNAFVEGVTENGLTDKVTVTQTGCVGLCQYEPIVEIYESGKDKVTYVKVTAEKAAEIIEKHLKGGQIVAEYTIGA